MFSVDASSPLTKRSSFRFSLVLAVSVFSTQATAGLISGSFFPTPSRSESAIRQQMDAGQAALTARDFAGADAAYKAAAQMAPSAPEPWLALAEVARVSGQAERIEPALAKAKSIAPKSAEVARAWALWHYANGKMDAAESAWREALKLDPQFVSALIDLGDFEFNVRGRPARAAEHYEQALRIDPKRAGAWFALGTSALALLQIKPAVEHMTKAVELSPGNALALAGLARALAADGQTVKALARYDEAVRISPQFAPARLERAELLRQAGRAGEALPDLQALTSSQPKLLAGHLALALNMEAQGRKPEALRAYQAVLRLDGKHVQALNNAAWIASEGQLGVADRGLAWAQAAQGLRPDDPRIAGTLAWVEAQRGDVAASIRRLRELIKGRAAQLPETHYLLGRVLAQSGDKPGARAALQQALQIDSKFTYAAEARELLQRLN
jgi:tetratricopeptide (TPR) repeat protein